jgi:hypothetical protein
MILGGIVNAEEANYDNVTGLYSATFNRAPDADGLKYWLDTKMELEDIAKSFFDQPETQALYPDAGTDNANFVDSTYHNLFNRAPDDEGMDYWKAQLEDGHISKSAFILAVVNGAKGTDADIMENKKQVGLDFVKHGGNDPKEAKGAMEGITEDKKTIEEAWQKFGYTPEQAELDHVRGDKPFDGKQFSDLILGQNFYGEKPEQPEKPEQGTKPEQPEQPEQSEQPEKPEQGTKPEQPEKPEQGENHTNIPTAPAQINPQQLIAPQGI